MRSQSGMSRVRNSSLSRRSIDRWLVAHAAHHEVEPLVGGELGTQPTVFVEIEGRELDRGELLDPERVLAPGLLVVLEAHVDLRPDAAGEKPVEVAHVVVGDVDVLVAEVRDLRPVLGVDQADLHLVDEGVPAVLLDLALRLGTLVRADVVVGQGVVDHLQPHLDRHLVGRGAVLPEQVLQHEHRNVRADLDLPHQVLADDLAGEDAVDLVVKGVARRGGFGHCWLVVSRWSSVVSVGMTARR